MTNYVWGKQETQFFFNLTPETILDAIDSIGFKTTGRCLPLNSIENRVYEVEIDRPEREVKSVSDNFIVTKFYRPGRWTKEQILDEHEFIYDLVEAEIPVIPPLKINGETLFEMEDHQLYYCVYEKRGGRNPEEMNEEQLEIMGRSLARIHNVGALKESKYRVKLNPESYGEANLDFLESSGFLLSDIRENYIQTAKLIINESKDFFRGVIPQRIHGDFHKGNIILRGDDSYFVDFDDMVTGPVVQDVWPVCPGDDQDSLKDRDVFLEAYDSIRTFPFDQLKMIPCLRALRLIHFSAWIAKRWEDPSFKHTFSYFESPNYWYGQLNDLRALFNKINETKNPYSY
ncbi:MAG: serine/threonine protein kinase [Halobacteriovoraceae bacterium]|nr:serine/threonine protein kinase [Halobacteriovoraceae bacterium]|tara:strand:- start:285 stop:1316 length:1032 start_codon:yes stop_codon:yes gene_type:complete